MAQKISTYLVEYVYKNGKKGNAHLPAKSKEHAIERWLRSGNKQPYIDTITARIMVKDKVLHHNIWWWGECYTLILDGGDALVNVSIENRHPEKALIHDLIVLESRRGNGYGNALLKNALKIAKKHGCDVAELTCDKQWVEDWYKRKGFVEVGVDEYVDYLQFKNLQETAFNN